MVTAIVLMMVGLNNNWCKRNLTHVRTYLYVLLIFMFGGDCGNGGDDDGGDGTCAAYSDDSGGDDDVGDGDDLLF